MGERTLTTLRLGGVPVGAYRDGGGLDPTLSPRPYLHPVRTLAGTVTRGLRVLLANGVLPRPRVLASADATHKEPDGDPQGAPEARAATLGKRAQWRGEPCQHMAARRG
jgi:Family of unknown function (DUF6807)